MKLFFLLSIVGCYSTRGPGPAGGGGERDSGAPEPSVDGGTRPGTDASTRPIGPCPDCPSDEEGCRVVPSVPLALEISSVDACPGDVLTVTLTHEVEGCGCSRDYVMSWDQTGWVVELTSEVRYCPDRCYDDVECTDTFTTRGHLIFDTPGQYVVRAATEERGVTVAQCP